MTQERNATDGSWIGSIRAKILSVTALLVVIPAMINGAFDVYRAVLKIPTNIHTETNDELFKRHFKKQPVHSQPIKIKSSDGIIGEILLEVYENGDIFVKYGNLEQWFPFGSIKKYEGALLIKNAYAETELPSQLPADKKKFKTVDPGPLIIDLKEIQQKVEEESIKSSSSKPYTIEKAYLVAKIKDDHSSIFGSSSHTYTMNFLAEPGYKITRYNFDQTSTNKAHVKNIELLNDGREIRIIFSLKSGPIFNRWEGWIKGSLQTTQQRIQ